MNAIGEIVVSNAVIVVILAAVIAVVGRFWKNPQGLHLLWLLVLLKFITPPLLTVSIHLPSQPNAVEANHAALPFHDDETLLPADESVADSKPSLARPSFDQEPIASAEKPVDAPSQHEDHPIPWLGILIGLWGIGIVGTGVWQAFRILRFHRLLKSALPASSDVLSMVAEVGKQLGLCGIPYVRMLPVRISPMVLSAGFRPQLLLPMELFTRLETTAQRSLLAHELAHIRRKDHLVRLLELLVTTLFWWHPVAWWACWELQNLEDLCCDAMVVGLMPEGKKTYATALMNTLDFLCDGSIAAPLGITATQSSVLLTRRIAMMKNDSGVMRLTLGRIVVLFLLAVVPMSIAFAATPPKDDDSAAVRHNEPTQSPVSPPKELIVDLGNGIKLELVLIPAGEFMMGLPGSDKIGFDQEKPQHRVRITKPFYLGKYLVTQEQWKAVTGNNPCYFQGPKNPVETVSWDDCREFLEKLNAKVGGGKFRLPSEAQWEYACRAGSKTRYWFGDDASKLGDYAWYFANSGGKPHPVGERKPNAWGLYDMQGNVWEWCQDWYDGEYYANSPTDDPTGPTTGSVRVHRGGHWYGLARDCRSTSRDAHGPGDHLGIVGLRVSLIPADQSTTKDGTAGDKSGKTSPAKPADEVTPASNQPATKEESTSDQPLKLVQQAAIHSYKGLVSGKGSGTYRQSMNGKPDEKCDFEIAFDSDRFNFLTTGETYFNRHIAISDESATVVRTFVKNLDDRASRMAYIMGPGTTHLVPHDCLPSLDLPRLTRSLFDPKGFEKFSMKVVKLPDGSLRGTYDINKYVEGEFEATRNSGYNITRSEGFNKSGGRTGTIFTAEWKRDGKVWYVAAWTRDFFLDGVIQQHSELRYKEFTANPKLSPDLFTLQQLHLPRRSSIVDLRPGPSKTYHYVDPSDTAKAQNVSEQVESMPRWQ